MKIFKFVIEVLAMIVGLCLLFNPSLFKDTDLICRAYGGFIILTLLGNYLRIKNQQKIEELQQTLDKLRKNHISDMMEDIKELINYKRTVKAFLISIKTKSRLSKADKTKIEELKNV